jgi:hypothetical protein
MAHPIAWRSELSEGRLCALRSDRGERFRLVGGDASQRATALKGNRPLPAFFGGGCKIVYLRPDQLKELGKLFEYEFFVSEIERLPFAESS